MEKGGSQCGTQASREQKQKGHKQNEIGYYQQEKRLNKLMKSDYTINSPNQFYFNILVFPSAFINIGFVFYIFDEFGIQFIIYNFNINLRTQMLLISSKPKNGIPQFQVHKQGLIMLRNFRNKRLRIIFNIIIQNNKQSLNKKQLQQFNQFFINSTHPQNIQIQTNLTCQPSNNNGSISQISNICQLRISNLYKQLSQNRVIIILNSFQSSDCPPYLLVLGYLVASVFLYHNYQKLSQQSKLTQILSNLKTILEDTQVHQLQQQIKYKSGCSKKPYFMCLFQEKDNQVEQAEGKEIAMQQIIGVNYHDQFRQFYKYRQGEGKKINQSVDTLIDYFPQRSALKIGNFLSKKPKLSQQSVRKIKKLGEQYVSKILGRQIFNFQITGSSLQNLCFQLCEVFNSKIKSINLQKIYTKIITNQKMQVSDQSIQKYTNLVNQLSKNLPVEMCQLLQSHSKIQKYVVQQSIADACNCMLFHQYLPIYNSLCAHISKKFKSVKQSNRQILQNRALNCYQQIQEDQQLQINIQNMNDQNYSSTLQVVQQKIQLFVEQIIHQFTTKDLLNRLINKLLQQYRQNLNTFIENKKNQSTHLLSKISHLQNQNRIYQAKCRQLENQYMYLNSINNQFKQKLLGGSKTNGNLDDNCQHGQKTGVNPVIDSAIVCELKRKVLDLEMQINQKNQIINSLGETLDKFDIDFNRKMFKPKFNQGTKNLLMQVSHKINDIYVLFGELKKTQQYYHKIQSQFNQKKSQMQRMHEKDRKIQLQTLQKKEQLAKQKNLLQQTINQARLTINNMQQVQLQYKDSINQLQNVCSRLKCCLADMEGQFQKYKKALELVSGYCVTAKIDKLRDFFKVSNDEKLKQLLRPIVKK